MPGLDTNVLARWLLNDDPKQADQVAELFSNARRSSQILFVPSTVLLELEWVLRSRYRFGKPTIVKTLVHLLETEGLGFENEDVLEQALDFYKNGSADFADCLHAAACGAAGHAPMLTFDRGAAKLAAVQLLEPSRH